MRPTSGVAGCCGLGIGRAEGATLRRGAVGGVAWDGAGAGAGADCVAVPCWAGAPPCLAWFAASACWIRRCWFIASKAWLGLTRRVGVAGRAGALGAAWRCPNCGCTLRAPP